jgi:SAM-dependent MidA family methyltransferase
MTGLHDRLVERIHRQGPIPFDAFVDAALYDPVDGFFARGRGAGRAGRDFVTSPEVGSLFGALVARALDEAWESLGSPDPYLVVDAGAGNGRLARDVLRATPRCAQALRLVLVERSRKLRDEQRERLEIEPVEDALGPAFPADPGESPVLVERAGPIVTALDDLPAIGLTGVVIANELLDNLPFRLLERGPRQWHEVRVGVDPDGALAEVLVPAPPQLASLAGGPDVDPPVEPGTRIPVITGAADWLAQCAGMLRRGVLVIIDYADDLASLMTRGQASWLRTYRAHDRGVHPLDALGDQDITYDIPAEQLRAAAERVGLQLVSETTQAQWLHDLGVDDLVAGARAEWRERARVGDLDAVAARSRVGEADALTDPHGLGAHRVFVFTKGRVVPPRFSARGIERAG